MGHHHRNSAYDDGAPSSAELCLRWWGTIIGTLPTMTGHHHRNSAYDDGAPSSELCLRWQGTIIGTLPAMMGHYHRNCFDDGVPSSELFPKMVSFFSKPSFSSSLLDSTSASRESSTSQITCEFFRACQTWHQTHTNLVKRAIQHLMNHEKHRWWWINKSKAAD